MPFPLKTSCFSVSLSSSPKNPRANIIKRRVSRASDGIPASRGGVSNASRALFFVCRINFNQKLLCEALDSKKKKQQKAEISSFASRAANAETNGIESECILTKNRFFCLVVCPEQRKCTITSRPKRCCCSNETLRKTLRSKRR